MMKIYKYGQWFITIDITKNHDVILAVHPKRWRMIWKYQSPNSIGTTKTWIGPFEIKYTNYIILKNYLSGV